MGINRTFMELKPSNTQTKFVVNLSINRTFMELKPRIFVSWLALRQY